MSTLATDRSALPNAFRQRTFLGHPIGLYILFFTEMWERFNYYGMRALLVLYMVKSYDWSTEDASKVYKWYTSLVYLTPLLGGFLADRYLGNKTAVVIGALLMALGEFLLVFDPTEAFFGGLIFLIIGNGFFKPNMSTQVGRLYPTNDGRRDGAYTIFYMGINLGAFLAPLICGWLAEHTGWGYHAGFAAAGVGMLLSLVIYLVGLPLVVELPPDAGLSTPTDTSRPATSVSEGITSAPAAASPITEAPTSSPPPPVAGLTAPTVDGLGSLPPDRPPSEAEAEKMASVIPWLNRSAPTLLLVLGLVLAVAGPLLAWAGLTAWDNTVGMEIAAVCSVLTAWITAHVHNAVRDRVLTIYVLGLFVIFFWAAFEQAGNALNLWADQVTNRYLTLPPIPPSIPPEQPVAYVGAAEMINPVPAPWFQSINPLAIFILAPLFAALWTFLAKRRMNISVPTKMGFGVLCMSLAFALMIASAQQERRPSEVALEHLPPGIEEADGRLRPAAEGEKPAGHPYLAGRVSYDAQRHLLHAEGVLPDTERDRMIRDSAPPYFKDLVLVLQAVTADRLHTSPTSIVRTLPRPISIDPAAWLPDCSPRYDPASRKLELSASLPLHVHLVHIPPGFDLSFAEFKDNAPTFDRDKKELTINKQLSDKEANSLLVAAGDPQLRMAVFQLYQQSAAYRVSSAWLFWFYILSTVGELCLSPIGLSMVSKLAPARFATMLMGLWLVTSFFGNFIAGAFGEFQGRLEPTSYFLIFVIALGIAALALFLLVRKIVTMMHGIL